MCLSGGAAQVMNLSTPAAYLDMSSTPLLQGN